MEEAGGSQSVDRATALLVIVAERHATGATLSEIVRVSRLTQPTARRLLVALIRAGLVEQSELTRRYHLGVTTYLYGSLAADRFASHTLAEESVRRLADHSGDTAFFSLRQGFNTLCMMREEGLHPIRSHVLNVGQRHPLGVAAHGIAILASLADAEVEAVISANREFYDNYYPMLTEPVLRALIAETRERGWSINRGLFHQGAWAIGHAIRNGSGVVIGGLSIGATESRLNEDRQPEIVALLKSEALKLEARIAAADSRAKPLREAGVGNGNEPRRRNGSERRL